MVMWVHLKQEYPYEVKNPLSIGDDREGIFLSCYIDDRDYHQEMAKVYVMVHLETFYIDHYIDQQVDKRGASCFWGTP